MNRLRVTLILSYSLAAFVALGMVLGIWHRATDPTWNDTLHQIRWEYDALAVVTIALMLSVVVGLLMRREWGRVFSIYLSIIVLFLYLGLPLYAVYLTRLSLSSVFGAESLIMSTLALLNVIGLSRRNFRESYASAASLKPPDENGRRYG